MYNLCCISNELKEEGHSFQTMTWKRFNQLIDSVGVKQALYELGNRWLNNVVVTKQCIEHCAKNSWGYRVSSDIFPILTHPDFKNNLFDVPQYGSIMSVFEQIKEFNLDMTTMIQKVRLSCHPDQFNVLASKNESAVKKTIEELNYHGWLMDMLGCKRNYENPINIHVNASTGDEINIVMQFMTNYDKLDKSVTSRLVLENEDKGIWTVKNLFKYFASLYRIPITFDNLHHKCNSDDLSEQEAVELCAMSWGTYIPLFHYSESDPDNKNQRAHAEYPTSYPQHDQYDWDIELKGKDKAIRAISLIKLTEEAQELNLGY